MSVIQRIKELASEEKTLGALYENAEGNLECTPMPELIPSLIQEHEALLRFVERVTVVHNGMMKGDGYNDVGMERALQALDKELKG